STKRVVEPEVIITIRDLDGRVLSADSTKARSAVIDAVEGERSIMLDIDDLPLAEGSYEVSLAVRDSTGQRELDVRSRMARFDVLRGDHPDGGVLTLGGTWKV